MSGLWRGDAPLVLASKSAARRALLAAAGVPFEAYSVALDEREAEAPLREAGAGAAEIAGHLARAKALAASAELPGRLVLAADQTLSCNGCLFTKPADRAAALAQLEALSGEVHELCSALCVVRSGTVLFETAPLARIAFRDLSPAFIAAYADLSGDAILASVGAYQFEGLGVHLIDRVEGDYATILGLPLTPLLEFLREEGSLLR